MTINDEKDKKEMDEEINYVTGELDKVKAKNVETVPQTSINPLTFNFDLGIARVRLMRTIRGYNIVTTSINSKSRSEELDKYLQHLNEPYNGLLKKIVPEIIADLKELNNKFA